MDYRLNSASTAFSQVWWTWNPILGWRPRKGPRCSTLLYNDLIFFSFLESLFRSVWRSSFLHSCCLAGTLLTKSGSRNLLLSLFRMISISASSIGEAAGTSFPPLAIIIGFKLYMTVTLRRNFNTNFPLRNYFRSKLDSKCSLTAARFVGVQLLATEWLKTTTSRNFSKYSQMASLSRTQKWIRAHRSAQGGKLEANMQVQHLWPLDLWIGINSNVPTTPILNYSRQNQQPEIPDMHS